MIVDTARLRRLRRARCLRPVLNAPSFWPFSKKKEVPTFQSPSDSIQFLFFFGAQNRGSVFPAPKYLEIFSENLERLKRPLSVEKYFEPANADV